jgi:hypothetical protein
MSNNCIMFADFLSPAMCQAHGITEQERKALLAPSGMVEEYWKRRPEGCRSRLLFVNRIHDFLRGYRAAKGE